MCNVDEDGEKEPVARRSKSGMGRKCVKCDQPGVLITRIHDSFCRDCFQVYVVHKFRSAIGKSKLIRDGEKVLVAFSGGTNSAALLNLISDGLSERAHKKLRFIPTLLHVDECTVIDAADDERRKTQKRIADIMVASGFPSYISSLEQAVETDINCEDGEGAELFWEAESDVDKVHIPTTNEQQRLKKLISSLSSETSKEDFLRNLRRQLIVAVAKKLGLKKILTGDCSTRLSIQILTDISQGRGSQVALDTAFSDARYDDIMVVRPVRDLNAKELAWYNRLFGVETVTIPSLTTKAQPGASIERLTQTFVTGLQADFPSTVSNIVRTSEKLLQPITSKEVTKCSFCESPLDTDVGPSSALNAIRFSKNLSQFSRQQKQVHDSACDVSHEDEQEALSMSDLSALSTENSTTDDSVLSSMCFGCQLSVKDLQGDDIESLPSFIVSRAQNLCQRDTLEKQISTFLLDDSGS